jgi:hypothetical protein
MCTNEENRRPDWALAISFLVTGIIASLLVFTIYCEVYGFQDPIKKVQCKSETWQVKIVNEDETVQWHDTKKICKEQSHDEQ